LDGIEKLTKLKVLYADQGNSYSDLSPLRGLGLTYLNIEFTKVTDISPLIDVPSLEVLDLSFLKIDDFSPLLQLPNLKTVILDNLEFTMKELKGNLKIK
jgi:Leucine-rich repeat (LRR) protein